MILALEGLRFGKIDVGSTRAIHTNVYGFSVTPHIGLWHWGLFSTVVLIALAIDLGLFHRRGRSMSFREAMFWTGVWAGLAIAFAWWIAPGWIPGWTATDSVAFLAGYTVELCLSMDNVFVIAMWFRFFGVPKASQHRVLFWGIVGALVMRGILIAAGSAAVGLWSWLFYPMGAFLVWTGVSMWMGRGPEVAVNPETNWVIGFARRWFRISDGFDGERLTTRKEGRWMLTPLAVVLMVVETTDVAFAFDSIPATFGITREPFIVFTSNIFAVLGLRSLYFVLASLMDFFQLIKFGLAAVLVVIGLKMLLRDPLEHWFGDRLMVYSLATVLGILMTSVVASLLLKSRENHPTKPGVS